MRSFDNESYLKRWHHRMCVTAQEMGLEVKWDVFNTKGSRICIEDIYVYFKVVDSIVTLELVSIDSSRVFLKRYNMLNSTDYTYKQIKECLNNIKIKSFV